MLETAGMSSRSSPRLQVNIPRFGAAYAQEDGVVFREESGAGGERLGQYSYVDQDGQTITVKYSAGVDGFRILEGDHVPTGANGQNSALHNPDYDYVESAPASQSQQTYTETNTNPFINPHDQTHKDLHYNRKAVSYHQYRGSVPPCADCAGVDPFTNPYDPSHRAGYVPPHQPAARSLSNLLTHRPRNNFPPGKLSLNRFETGFNFDFES